MGTGLISKETEPPKEHPKRAFLIDRLAKWAMDWALVGLMALLLALFTPYWSQVVAVWQTPQKLDQVFARLDARQAEMAEVISDLRDGVRRANGEDRVIFQPPGLSYIEEPVSQGENVAMIMVAERTALGRDCRLENWTPIFTDELNIPTPGQRESAGPVRRQITTQLVPLRIVMIPPHTLRPGRITVYLTLDYRCGDQLVPDKSLVLAYRLLPGAGNK